MIKDKLIKRLNISETKMIVLSNIVWALLGKIINLLSVLFVGILIARHLGPAQYGTMNYVISIVSIFSVFATFGTSDIIIRELSKKDKPKEVILGTAFALRLLLATMIFFSICIYLLFSGEETATTYMILVYSSSMFFSCFDVIRHYFTSIIQNQYIVKSEITRTIVGSIIKIILLLFNAPLYAFMFALTFDFALIASGYYYSYGKKVGSIFRWQVDKELAKTIISTSFPLLLSGAAVIIYQRIDQVMIKQMIDDEAVGYFSTAASFVGVIIFIPTIIVQTVSPLLVKYKESNDDSYKSKGQLLLNINVWITIILCCLIAATAYPLIMYTYGDNYSAAIPILQILAFKAVGMALSASAGQLIVIENIHKYAFIRNLMACAVCIGLNLIFIPRWGIMGSAWVTLITLFFSGGFANIFIPAYHHIFKMQCKALFFGWKDLAKAKSLIN